VKEILLTQGKVALVDDEDFSLVAPFKWHALKGRNGVWYAATTLEHSRVLLMHRLILGIFGNLKTDHKDKNGLNNRMANLRAASVSQNNANSVSRRPAKSGFRGVFKDNRRTKNPWYVRVGSKKIGRLNGGSYFATPSEAAHRYDELAKQLYGEFAVLNFP